MPRPTAPIATLMVFLSLLSAGCGRGHEERSEDRLATRTIQNKGSDTMLQLAEAWAELYREVRPDISIAVTGGGSGTGIAALMNGTVDIANLSRSMTDDEVRAARALGVEPIAHEVAIDALAILVHPTNPVSHLTIDQLSDIFSGRTKRWSEVGGRDEPIVPVSRETNSGTHVYFLETVVRRGNPDSHLMFAPQTLLMPSSVGITSEVERNPRAIGYDGLGYVTAGNKVVAIAASGAGPFVSPSVATATAGSYPLSRPLHMVTAGEPPDDVRAYLEWIRGPEGQRVVRELGFVPVDHLVWPSTALEEWGVAAALHLAVSPRQHAGKG